MMLTVVLLVTQSDLEPFAVEIRETLLRKFFNKQQQQQQHDDSVSTAAVSSSSSSSITVHVRSGLVPPERLLTAYSATASTTQQRTLFVLLGPETAATLFLQTHSVHPVLTLPAPSSSLLSLSPPFSSWSAAAATHQATTTETAQQPVVPAADADEAALILSFSLQIAKFCAFALAPSSADDCSVAAAVARAVEATQQQLYTALVHDATIQTAGYGPRIAACYDAQQQITGDQVAVATAERVMRGKVRDRWERLLLPAAAGSDNATTAKSQEQQQQQQQQPNKLALVTTDRQSGFDRQLAVVPYKGAVLNLCSQFWFDATKDIISNHLLATPHPSVAIVRQCQPFPIEFVVRSYLTGSTSTSIWKNYSLGVRNYCGHVLQEGMTKNQKLPTNLLTPTTKEEDHDRPISLQEIVAEKWMTREDLDVCSAAALAVFARGQEIAKAHGLILVDTKYEFGRCCETGEILLIDEVHTPDSSRYWLGSSYAERIAAGLEPENIDKEFLRLWFADNCDPYKDETIPEAPRDLVLELSRRYIQLYEMITGKDFDFEAATTGEPAIAKAIADNI